NGSTDNTAQIARDNGAIVRSEPLLGKGNVVRRMFADVDADVYVLVDGDGTYDAGASRRMVELVTGEGEDFVNATRVPVDTDAYRRGHVTGNRALTGFVQLLFRR